MQPRHIVVIGGSAGVRQPLQTIVGNLPADFSAPIFVVVHVPVDFPNLLDRELSRVGPLTAKPAHDGELIRRGRIYVARPDHHLTLEAGQVRVTRGPRENRHRPAIDPLFRSAAREFGDRVIAVLLSGQLDDGSAGLFAIRHRGGVAIVQDPKDAVADEMPRRALAYAGADYVLPAVDIAPKLIHLVNTDHDEIVMPTKHMRRTSGKNNNNKDKKKVRSTKEQRVADAPDQNLEASYPDEGEGVPSVFACPECHGVLWEVKDKGLVRFRCRVGHSFGTESLAKELSEASENALWAAMRALEEKAAMDRRMADSFEKNEAMARRLRDQAASDDVNARVIRELIFQRDAELESGESESGEAESKKTA